MTIPTTRKIPTGETPFLIVYSAKVMSSVDVRLPFPCRLHFSQISNDELRRYEFDFFDEQRELTSKRNFLLSKER